MYVEIECESCGGTGLYRGFAEPEGVAVVCVKCDGHGKDILKYTPFTKRKHRPGVHTVRRSKGSLLVTGGSVSYEEFHNGKMP